MTRYPRNLEYLANDPPWIYTIWRDDECLYVGMTSDWRARTSVHVRDYMREPYNATHIDVWAAADNRTEAERLESQTIVDLDPLYNTQHSPRARLTIPCFTCTQFTGSSPSRHPT